MSKEVERSLPSIGKLFFVYILPAMIIAGAVGDFVGMRFHTQSTPSSEILPVPSGWAMHKGDYQDDPQDLAYTILTKGIGSPMRNPENGSLADDRIDINIVSTTSSPEAYIAYMELSGTGSWGTFFSDKIYMIGTNYVILFNSNKAEYFDYTNSADADLEKAGKGYVITPHLYKFEEYGVPQQRHRIVIIGIRKDLGLKFRVPAQTTKNKYVTARQAIENPPIPPGAANHERTKQSAVVVERLKHIPAGENAWYEGIPQHLRLNVEGARMSQIYKRLDPNKPSYTITGSGGGGTHVYHWSENRALTNRERARLQSFPDSFIFEGSKESARKQIGMAVPPMGAQFIMTAVLKTFAGLKYESIEENIPNGEVDVQKIKTLLS